jgi:predicted naringenin-chalcone synthase
MEKLALWLITRAMAAFFIGCAALATALLVAIAYYLLEVFPEYVQVLILSGLLALIYFALHQEYCRWLRLEKQTPL